MLAGLRQARRGPRWIELTRSAGPRRPFSHPSSVPEPLLVAKVRWRLDGFCVVAATNKCLAQSDKSHVRGKATKKRTAKTSGIRRLVRVARRRFSQNHDAPAYRVNFRDGNETTAYYTDNLEDAVNTAVEMARKRGGPRKEFRNLTPRDR